VAVTLQTIVSHVTAAAKKSDNDDNVDASVWNACHVNLTISLLLMLLLAVNAVSFIIWLQQLSMYYDLCVCRFSLFLTLCLTLAAWHCGSIVHHISIK